MKFQFVDYTDLKNKSRNLEADLATAALMEIPEQFKLVKKLRLL
jgi:hypothetical protein